MILICTSLSNMNKGDAACVISHTLVKVMNSVKMRFLMNFRLLAGCARKLLRLSVISALLLNSIAFSQEVISSKKSLEHALEGAVTCNLDALGDFIGSEYASVPGETTRGIEALGGAVANDPEQLGAVRFHFPAGTRVFGYEAREATFFSESTILFFVTLESSLANLNKINEVLKLHPIENGNPDGYGYFDKIDVRYIRKLNGHREDFPYTIFSGVERSDGRGKIVVGCQNLAW